MQVTREVGIKMAVDSTAVAVGTQQAAREIDRLGTTIEQAGDKGTRSLASVSLELKNIVVGAGALTVVSSLVQSVSEALTSLPRDAFNYTKNIETSTLGMAGILGSMTAINGKQTEYNTALAISSQYIRKLNDDALRTAATSQELVGTFQALLAPGLAAKMTLNQIRELTVVGTNAVKSMGVASNQVVQELRDLVSGGITASGSTLASSLGLSDSDIAKAKASSEGLFAFLMARLQGFKRTSEEAQNTLQGLMDTFQEGAVRVAAEGMKPLTDVIKTTLAQVTQLFTVIDKTGAVQLNPQLVESIAQFGDALIRAIEVGKQLVSGLWEHRDAVVALWTAYKAYSIGQWAAEALTAVRAKLDLAAASRLAATQSAYEGAANAAVALSSREKAVAYIAELEIVRLKAQAHVAETAAQVSETTAKTASLALSREAVVLSRAEVNSKMEATRTTIAQAQAQLAAAQSAGALSFALASAREATDTLSVAHARHAALLNELAVLGRQQASVAAASVAAAEAQTAATVAHTAAQRRQAVLAAELATLGRQQAVVAADLASATAGQTLATGRLTLAQNAAALAGRGLSAVLAALGGPVGVAVAAIAGLVMWFFKSRDAAKEAEDAAYRYKKAKDALSEGKPLQSRELISLTAQLNEAQKELDELEKHNSRTETTNSVAAGRRAGALAAAQAKVNELDGLIKKSQSLQAGGNEELTLSAAATQQAWEKTVSGAKTASAAQEEYQQKIDASRASFVAYKAMLESTGASTEVIAKAQQRQSASEVAFAAERDRKLKEMNASAVTATSQTINAQIEQLKRKEQVEEVIDKRATDMLQTRLQLGLVTEREYMEQVAAIELAGMTRKRDLTTQQLALAAKNKDTAKEQAALSGQIAELDEKRLSREITLKSALQVLDEKRRKEAEALRNASLNAAQQSVDALEERNRATAQEIEAIGLTEAAMHRLTNARFDEIIAREQERIAVLQSFDLAGQSQDLIDIEIRKLNALKEARNLNDRKYGVEQIAKINEAWLNLKNDVYMGLTDSLYRAFEQGGNFFSTFWAGIKNTLKTTVLKVGIQGVMGSISGLLGFGSDSGSGFASLSSLSNMWSAGSTAFTALTTGISGAVGSAVSSVFGAAAGNTVLGTMVTGSASSAAAGAAAAAAAGGTSAAGAGAAGSLMSGLAAIPGWGWAAMGVAALLSMDFGGGGGGKTGAAGGVGVDDLIAQYADDQKNGNFVNANAKPINDSIEASFANYASALGDKKSTFKAGSMYAMDNAGTGDAQTQLQVVGTLNGQEVYNRGDRLGGIENVDRGQEALTKELAAESLRAVYAGLQQSDIPQQIKDYLGGIDIGADSTLLQQRLDEVMQVKSLSTAYGALNNDLTKVFASSVATSQALIKAAGGFDAFTAKYNSYLTNFYSDSERQALGTANMAAAFKDLGLTMPTTREAFRAMVEDASKTLNTEAGISAYNALLSLAEGFAAIVPASESATEALQAVATAAKKIVDEAKARTDAAMSVLQTVAAREREALDARRQVAAELVSSTTQVFDTLKSAIADLGGNVDAVKSQSAAQGRQFLDQALSAAQQGYLPDNGQLNDAISAAKTDLVTSKYSTKADYERDVLSLRGQLVSLKDVAGVQKTVAEQTLAAAESQLAQLEKLLTSEQDQLDMLRGINTSVLTVTDALKLLHEALTQEADATGTSATVSTVGGAASFGGGGGGGGAGSVVVNNGTPVQDMSGFYGAGNAFNWLQDENGGWQRSDAYNPDTMKPLFTAEQGGTAAVDENGKVKLTSVPRFAGGGDHAGGARIVGEYEPELEVTGPSRIYNGRQMRDLLQGTDNMAPVLERLDRLTEAVERLEGPTNTTAVATHNMRSSMDDWEMMGLKTRTAVTS